MIGPKRPRLLAIDGGGVKGLAALICLLQVMVSLRFALTGKHTGPLPKPCDYFDMIVGTSTGG
jgi:patatin-like phospholipase/acyl hydrolase